VLKRAVIVGCNAAGVNVDDLEVATVPVTRSHVRSGSSLGGITVRLFEDDAQSVMIRFFDEDGSLKANATKAQMESGFLWACEYGRNDVVDFLLQRGADVRAQSNTGLTGLHWAVVGGKLATIKLLLERGAPLDARNVYGATAFSQALWSAFNGDAGIDYVPVIEMLVDAGAKVEPGSLAWLAKQTGSASTKVRLEALLRRHGTTS